MSNPEDPVLGPNDPATAYHDLLAREAALETLDGRVATLEGTLPTALAAKLAAAANLSDVADPDVARDNLNAQEAGTSVLLTGRTANSILATNGSGAVIDVPGAGVLLAYSNYAGVGGAVATTSSSYADIDAAEQVVTFTVPVSGAVLIRASARINIESLNAYGYNLREGGSDVAGTAQTVGYYEGANTWQCRTSAVFVVTGLTPGASKTYKLGHARLGGSGVVSTLRAATDPVTMEVWSL
jgi:hypothetical protein